MEWLISQTHRGVPPLDVIFMIAVFGAAVLLALALISLFVERDPVAERLKSAGGTRGAGELSIRYQGSSIDRLLGPFRRAVTPRGEKERSLARLRMVRAGYMNPGAVSTFYALRGVLSLLLPTATLWVLPFANAGLAPPAVLTLVLVSGAVGFFFPKLYIARRIAKRQREAQDGFPDALDTLLVCVEAGLSLAAAIDRVASEIGQAYPVLGDQFKLLALEINAGKTREVALRNMADRIGIDEVYSLVTLLLQSEALGTSIAQALRVYAQEMRAKRLVRAEERANKLPVKIVFPLAFCVLPALVSVIMTPLIIRILRQILSHHAGG
jgi:tight adherence protein C